MRCVAMCDPLPPKRWPQTRASIYYRPVFDLRDYVSQSVTVRCSVILCVAVRCNVLQCVAVCCSVRLERLRVAECCSALQCDIVRCNAIHCNTLRHTATHSVTLQRTATHSNTYSLKLNAATHCNTQYHILCVAVCCSVQLERLRVAVCCSALQCHTVCCSVSQCVAVYCSVLQCSTWETTCRRVLQCVAVCDCVLQCVAMCCSVYLAANVVAWFTMSSAVSDPKSENYDWHTTGIDPIRLPPLPLGHGGLKHLVRYWNYRGPLVKAEARSVRFRSCASRNFQRGPSVFSRIGSTKYMI